MSESSQNPALSSLLNDLDEEQLKQFHKTENPEKLKVLASLSELPEDVLYTRIANGANLDLIERPQIADNPLDYIPLKFIHNFHCLPIHQEGDTDTLKLATLWLPEPQMNEWIYAICKKQVEWVLSSPEWLNNTINKKFGVGSGSLDDDGENDELNEEELDEEDENTAIIRFVNEIFAQATRDRATDIHVEPRKDTLHIRYRIDGRLVAVALPQNLVNYQSAIISRIKIMARLNISEKRRPQDGRITYSNAGRDVDIRVSTLPTMYGESVSMRLLNEDSQPVSIPDLGILPEAEKNLERVLDLPHGIVLITGPTGSGKSTTLTAFIRKISTPEKRIITVEDPIEYEIPEVNQTQVQSEVGLTFAAALRSVLRQDPDVLMVGEIRDSETADIAVRASLTGHLVLSTLHTNDAPGALTRLIDMEIEPFLIASSVEMIVAQRLVRRLCPNCAAPMPVDHNHVTSCLTTLSLPHNLADNLTQLHQPVGCEFCSNLGYRGRIGMFEILMVTDSLHELIIQKASAREIKKRAFELGMRSIQSCGWEHVIAGRTTLPEIIRYSEIQEED